MTKEAKQKSQADFEIEAPAQVFNTANSEFEKFYEAVKGDKGNLLMASEFAKNKDGIWGPVGGKADIVDGKKLKPQCWYIVEGGEWVEVDYTNRIFSRVLSTKGGVKKVKTDNNKILYIASDGENHAHGETLKKELEELKFKTASRDVSQYKNMALAEILVQTKGAYGHDKFRSVVEDAS